MTNKNSINSSNLISPIDFAREMLKNTAEDGTLYLNEWCDDNNYKVNIEWRKENLEEIICKFNALVKDLKVIADFTNEFAVGVEMIPEMLIDDSVTDTYYNFVAPFESENKEDFCNPIFHYGGAVCFFLLLSGHQRKHNHLFSPIFPILWKDYQPETRNGEGRYSAYGKTDRIQLADGCPL